MHGQFRSMAFARRSMVIAASISLNVPTNGAYPNCIDAIEKIIAAIIRMRTGARPASVWRIRFNVNSIRNVYRGEFCFCVQLCTVVT